MFRKIGTVAALAWAVSSTAIAQDIDQRVATLEQLLDREAVEQLIVHYGRANDIIGRGHGDRSTAIEASLEEYRRAFTNDATITVFPLGSNEPLQSTDNISDWAAFVGQYFEAERYSSTLHLMSNFAVEFVGDSTAQASAFAINPHWILSPEAREPETATRAMDLMNVRYVYEARRQANGDWRITDMTIFLDEIFNGVGFFGAGQTSAQ